VIRSICANKRIQNIVPAIDISAADHFNFVWCVDVLAAGGHDGLHFIHFACIAGVL